MILSPLELEQLTGKTERGQKRYGSQAKVLRALGIPFLPRPDRTLIVYRERVYGQTTQKSELAPAVLP